jgi:hypothetical protein
VAHLGELDEQGRIEAGARWLPREHRRNETANLFVLLDVHRAVAQG